MRAHVARGDALVIVLLDVGQRLAQGGGQVLLEGGSVARRRDLQRYLGQKFNKGKRDEQGGNIGLHAPPHGNFQNRG